jgi:hypothetical protein
VYSGLRCEISAMRCRRRIVFVTEARKPNVATESSMPAPSGTEACRRANRVRKLGPVEQHDVFTHPDRVESRRFGTTAEIDDGTAACIAAT